MLVRYVTTLIKSSSERSLKPENSGNVIIGAPSFPRPPEQDKTFRHFHVRKGLILIQTV